MPPLGGSCLYTPRRDVPCVLMQTCLQAFLSHPTGAETICCEIFPTRSLVCCRDFPLSEYLIFQLWDVSPLRGSRLYTPRRDVPLHRSVNANMPTGLSRSSKAKTLRCRIFPTRTPVLLHGFFPLRTFDLSMMGCAPTRRTASVYS